MSQPKNKSALIAVSGGLDSICLLFSLAKNLHNTKPKLECSESKIDPLIQDFIQNTKLNKLEAAYLDHAQRPDTNLDFQSVQKICTQLNIELHHQKLNLPPNCSEELARKARYQALGLVQKNRKLDHIITAHHADDVLETALINLTRGSGTPGLSSLSHHQNGIWRPFLSQFQKGVFVTKADLHNYAKLNKLSWHEDSTNQDSKYLRNRLRAKLKTSNKEQKLELLNLIAKSSKLNSSLKDELSKLELTLKAQKSEPNLYSRSTFLELEPDLQKQFIHLKLSQLGYDVNQESVGRAVKFIEEAKTKKNPPTQRLPHPHPPKRALPVPTDTQKMI